MEGRLWVGRYVRPDDVPHLRRLGVTTVINLQSDADLKACKTSLAALCALYDRDEIELRRVPIADFDEGALAQALDRCVGEIESALARRWAKVYLHCTAGVNRSPTAAAAYLVKAKGYSARQAFDFVVGKRYCEPYLKVLEGYAARL
ncbi:MAG: dual specificity protein phosphatase family protein [Acidobacteriota bacterium]|nr:dual specificity protein phosphatase family protein [Acidobacteriota bacterium]